MPKRTRLFTQTHTHTHTHTNTHFTFFPVKLIYFPFIGPLTNDWPTRVCHMYCASLCASGDWWASLHRAKLRLEHNGEHQLTSGRKLAQT